MSNLVSVIIPAYNVEKTIEKCVESILKQHFQNFEIIIVDDGSIDKTFMVCNSLKEKDSRILVVHQKNGGSSAARNTGIMKAKGRYIVFVDGDDCVDDNYLEKLIFPSIQNDIDVVVCGITIYYQKQKYSVSHGFKKIKAAADFSDVSELIYESCENGMIYSPCNKLYKRDIIMDNHILFPINKEPIEDVLFNCEYMKHISSLAVIPECPYFYNKNDIESNVTRFRKNIWDLSRQRSMAIQSLFEYWKMNTEVCVKWLASEYIGGKSDCISNCYRNGSELHFFERYKLFKRYIMNDQICRDKIAKLKGVPLHYDKRILKALIKVRSALIFTCAYDILFFFRYRLKGIYYCFRKYAGQKNKISK